MWTISLRDDERENVTMSEILERQLPSCAQKATEKKKMKNENARKQTPPRAIPRER